MIAIISAGKIRAFWQQLGQLLLFSRHLFTRRAVITSALCNCGLVVVVFPVFYTPSSDLSKRNSKRTIWQTHSILSIFTRHPSSHILPHYTSSPLMASPYLVLFLPTLAYLLLNILVAMLLIFVVNFFSYIHKHSSLSSLSWGSP